ncbi:hypothetical protein [Halorussus sp. AFM4]|uniref:hypothetical protein n=1 Tax=Halorussus sp. AFM4 TaxID=3421651 RepID=UPI003EBA945C
MSEDPSLGDLLDSRDEIADLREKLKATARDARDRGEDVNVDNLLALSRNNDAAYVMPSDLKKAEWFANIWEQEGRPEVHPRGLHYQILGEGYELRDGTKYENTQKCWNELKDAAKWAQILGLVDPDSILDAKNWDPEPTAFDNRDDPAPAYDQPLEAQGFREIAVDDGFRRTRIALDITPARVNYESPADLIETQARRIVEAAFDDVYYHATARQQYYIELWSEKQGVLKESLAAEYGATIREAGGGEFSYSMCRDAIQIAEQRDQDLVVVIISDFDPKGLDMPKSAARKIEVEAAFHDVEARVHHAALTKEQVEEYVVPATPAKEPRGLIDRNPGALAYERQKDYFADYAKGDPVEINSFEARYPDEYEQAIRDILDPYYDDDLGDRIEAAIAEEREETLQRLREAFRDHADDIADAIDELKAAIDEYELRLEPDFEDVRAQLEELKRQEQLIRRELSIDEKREALRTLVDEVDHEQVLAEADVDIPSPGLTVAMMLFSTLSEGSKSN